MALKRNITKAEFEKLPKDIQTEYAEDGEGYKLDLAGEEDTGALKRAKDREKQLRQEAEERSKKLQDDLDKLQGDDARKNGDIETLEKQWKKQNEEQSQKYQAKLDRYEASMRRSLVNDTAEKLALEISTSPKLLLPHIISRLTADLEGETPSTKILDANGQASALTLDDLKKEFVANKDFASIIIGSKSSGGANTQNRNGVPNTQNKENVSFEKLSNQDAIARIKERKQNSQE